MIDYIVLVLRAQKPHTRGNRAYERTRRKGIRRARHWYSRKLVDQAWQDFCGGHIKDARRDFAAFIKYAPPLAGWILSQAAVRTCLRRLGVNRKSRRRV